MAPAADGRGFDPAADYLMLTREQFGRRTDKHSPAQSLLLLKGVGAVPHEGGQRFGMTSVPGEMVLAYPKWVPGGHTPRNEIAKVVDLHITANGKPVEWKRDPVEAYAFHLDVPKGAKSIEVTFKYVTSTKGDQGRMMVTRNLESIEPIGVSFYPASYFVRQIPIRMSVKYPEGWSAASATSGRDC